MTGRGVGGFTLIEVLTALTVLSVALVFLVGALANLSRHLSRAEVRIEALNLAGEKILEWAELLRQGGRPTDMPSAGRFEGHPGFEWMAGISQSPLDEAVYELRLDVFKRAQGTPTFSFRVEGRRRQLRETVGGA